MSFCQSITIVKCQNDGKRIEKLTGTFFGGRLSETITKNKCYYQLITTDFYHQASSAS